MPVSKTHRALNIPDRNSIDYGRNPSITFRCRLLDTNIGKDTHRTFTGTFFPRFANLFLDEVVTTTVGGLRGQPTIRLVETYPLDVYRKEDGENFVVGDFVAGNKLSLGPSAVNRDRVPRVYTITEVNTSKLENRKDEFERTATMPPADGFQTQRLRDLPQSVRDSLITVREAFIERCGGQLVAGIKEIGRRFRIMDDSGDRFLSKAEFIKSLKDVGCELAPQQVEEVFVAMDATGDGMVDYEEYMCVIRGPMNARRKLLVAEAFDRLDNIKRDGVVTLGELLQKYNAKRHPEVLAGRKTEKEVVADMAAIWDVHDKNGLITYSEFLDYYNGVSASVDDDDYFELMLRNSWHMSGGKGVCANTANKRVAVEHSDGSQKVYELTDDIGLDTSDRATVIAKLESQGITGIAKIDLGSGMS